MKQVAPIIVTAIVLLGFSSVVALVFLKAIPSGSEQIANIMIGSLSTMAGACVQYWVGSSSGSAAKTELLYNSVPADKK